MYDVSRKEKTDTYIHQQALRKKSNGFSGCITLQGTPGSDTYPVRKKIGFLVYTKQASMTGDVMGLLFDYLMGITLIDVGRINGILQLIDENREAVLEAFTFVGRLDAALSILSFRKSLPHWTTPIFTESGEITARELYHPLIKEPVSNDFTLQDRAILTGANASGKSTFMKSMAVSVILAQTIDTACCKGLSLPVMKVMTSMAIRDDVVSGESYYIREVRYLKRMLDEILRGTMTLCVIDEILKGTNQAERLAASEAVLKYLTQFQGYCMIATHDMELVEKLGKLRTKKECKAEVDNEGMRQCNFSKKIWNMHRLPAGCFILHRVGTGGFRHQHLVRPAGCH